MFSKARKGTVITHLCSSFSLLQKAGFGFGGKETNFSILLQDLSTFHEPQGARLQTPPSCWARGAQGLSSTTVYPGLANKPTVVLRRGWLLEGPAVFC